MIPNNNLFLEAFNGANRSVPIWIMRQAGRYMKEYMEIRKNYHSIFDMILDSDMASYITMMPIKRFDFDAAVIFSDILIIFHALGIKVEFVEHIGPIIGYDDTHELEEKLVLSNSYIRNLSPVFDTVKKTREALEINKSVIGFSGSPFTLCCYLFEKGTSGKGFQKTKEVMYRNPELFDRTMNQITSLVTKYVIEQIKSGADAIQLFDTHSGIVSGDDFHKYIIEPTKLIVSKVREIFPLIPIIGFPKGAGVNYMEYAMQSGVNGVSVDYSVSVSWIRKNLSDITLVQGNLDPSILAGSITTAIERTKLIVDSLSKKRLIFNLGHGILPSTNEDDVEALVKYVKGIRL